MRIVLFLLFTSLLRSQMIPTEKLRVLYTDLEKGLQLTCPTKNITTIYWVNETGISNIPDNEIAISTLNLLIPSLSNTLLFVFTDNFTELSCGFFPNSAYTRIKRWSITYIDSPEVILKTKIDENFFKLTPYNVSFSRLEYKISNKTLNNLSESRIIFRLDCEANFDRPLIIKTVIRLQYVKYGSTNETFEMVTNNEYPNDMQVFEGNGSKIEFIVFLKKLYNNPDNESYISLQCVNFLDEFQIGPKSNEFNIVKIDSDGNSNGGGNGNSGNGTDSSNVLKSREVLSSLEVALICVFSILGLILVLGLLVILYCCCFGVCSKKNKNKYVK